MIAIKTGFYFIPSYKKHGKRKNIDNNCTHDSKYQESTFGGDVVCIKCHKIINNK
jgi:hypothetical protein